jgi:Protein of unknown function (DUF2855)
MGNLVSGARLLSRKTELADARVEPLSDLGLAEGEALLAVDRVAVTTNNITYAVFGDVMKYWHFFPSGQDAWGQMPVWGFADVVESRAQGVEKGERFYGYFPIATHLRVRPERCSSRGFYDGTPHRAALTSAYNQYTRCATDPVYDPALENQQILLRPLIITSFFGADFLADNGCFGAERVIFSSASSKTAYGTAFCLRGMSEVELVGLTSSGNRQFTESLGCYHRVLTYDELPTLSAETRTVYFDYSGDNGLRARLHEQLGDGLVYDCVAGSAQNSDPNHLAAPAMPGPKPTLYFAPDQIKKRNREWGYDEVNRRFGETQRAFIARVADRERPWMTVVEHHGLDEAASLISELAAGRIDPRQGHVVVLG